MREMKDSGIEWIGEIPDDWDVIKTKYVILNNDGGIWGNDSYDDNNAKIVLRSTEQTIDGKWLIEKPALRDLSALPYQSCLIKPGDLLITKSSGSKTHIGKTTIADDYFENHECYYSNFLQRIRLNNKIYNKFMWYLQNSNITRQQYVYRQNSTSGIGNINSTDISSVYIPFPSLPEQRKIAAYLDKKCSSIDSLAQTITAQIKTLEQYKRSVITEAVTKGLDPDAEMKDSGIEWIGKIPKDWNVHPVYYYFTERKNKNSLGEESNLLSLSYGRVIRKDINTLCGLLPESFNTYNIVEPGDIIIRPTDLQNDKRSLRTGLVTEHGIITSAYIALRAIRLINVKYYHYLLHSFDVMKVFYNMGNGVRQGLNFSEFAKLLVLEPSLKKQDEIVAYLDKKCNSVDNLIQTKQDQLSALDEYKKSLIYEYVTGKKEVPA